MSWMVRFRDARRLRKAVEKLRPSSRRCFAELINVMAREGPQPGITKAEPLHGHLSGQWKAHVDIRTRILYTVDFARHVIEIHWLGPRGSAY